MRLPKRSVTAMDYKKPTKAEALQQLSAAIKAYRAAFKDDYPNFCTMLDAWENRTKDIRFDLVHKQ